MTHTLPLGTDKNENPAITVLPIAEPRSTAACDMLDLLANEWSTLALGALEDGPRRFGVIRTKLERVSPKVLTATLRRLEEHGLVDRTVYPAVPLHVEYSLTDLGRDACEPLALRRRWVVDNVDRFPVLSDPRASVGA